MPTRLLASLLALLTLVPGPGVATAPLVSQACRGMAVATFEQRFPAEVRHFDFDQRMVDPFLRMWRSKRRPDLPVPPEWVRVYAVPDRPYLVGFHRAGCVIALFTVKRRALWRWLRPELGWPA